MSALRLAGAPLHPGSFVKALIVDELGLSVTDAAQALGITRPALSKFLNERVSLSPEMAVRIDKAFGFPLDALMQMQNAFDIDVARKRARDIEVLPFRARVSTAAFVSPSQGAAT